MDQEERNFMRRFIIWGLIALLFIAIVYYIEVLRVKKQSIDKKVIPVPSEELDPENISHKEITGKVTVIAYSFITISYKQDLEKAAAYSMVFPVNRRTVEIVNKNSFDDIQIGDTITIKYDEVRVPLEKGMTKKSRRLRSIIFLESGQ